MHLSITERLQSTVYKPQNCAVTSGFRFYITPTVRIHTVSPHLVSGGAASPSALAPHVHVFFQFHLTLNKHEIQL